MYSYILFANVAIHMVPLRKSRRNSKISFSAVGRIIRSTTKLEAVRVYLPEDFHFCGQFV